MRKPYRKGREYFYIINLIHQNGYLQKYFNRRGTATPLKHLTAKEMHDWCVMETIVNTDMPELTQDEVSVSFYHIERN